MRRYNEAVKADVKKRMSPPGPQDMARSSQQLGIHGATLYSQRKAWRLQREVMPAAEKDVAIEICRHRARVWAQAQWRCPRCWRDATRCWRQPRWYGSIPTS